MRRTTVCLLVSAGFFLAGVLSGVLHLLYGPQEMRFVDLFGTTAAGWTIGAVILAVIIVVIRLRLPKEDKTLAEKQPQPHEENRGALTNR